MRRLAFLLVFVTGCSTAPCADFLDHFFPARIDPAVAGQHTRGGVCDPQTQANPAIGPGNPANTPSNPAVGPGPAGGPPMLPAPSMAPPSGAPGELPTPTPPSPALRW